MVWSDKFALLHRSARFVTLGQQGFIVTVHCRQNRLIAGALRQLGRTLFGIPNLGNHRPVADGGRTIHGAIFGQLPAAVILPGQVITQLVKQGGRLDRALAKAPHILVVGTTNGRVLDLPELKREGY